MAMTYPPFVYTQEQVEWLERRGWGYRVLMDFLSRPPRMSLIAHWRYKAELIGLIPASRSGRKLTGYLKSIPEQQFRQVCSREAAEYERLFTGREAVMTSCESLFRCRTEGADAAVCISEVRKIYMENGIVFNKLNGERDDHIALELEFMAVLAEGMLSKSSLPHTCQTLADVQIGFLESHLLKWVRSFANELMLVSSSPLYTGLAELLDEFLDHDLRQLRQWRDTQRRPL